MAKVGIIGCGVISKIYLEAGEKFPILEMVACADLEMERALSRAEEFGVEALTPEALLARSDIDIVINLTIPAAHASVSTAAVEAGKSIYSEKPLALEPKNGRTLLAAADKNSVRVGCAPDTFLGGGLQTCRDLLDAGAIGEPLGATAFMMSSGPERWHPSPEFFYKVGGGPMFDMGPYYLTALISMLGAVERVAGSARISFAQRTVGSGPLQGQTIDVEIPTYVSGTLDFASGPIANIVTSFDVWGASLPRIEIYGSEGSLSLPDPNTFGGPVKLLKAGEKEWREVEISRPYTANSRGLGVADMAHALHDGRPHRASGEMAFHVLEIMSAIHTSAAQNQHVTLESSCERPAPLPADLPIGNLAG